MRSAAHTRLQCGENWRMAPERRMLGHCTGSCGTAGSTASCRRVKHSRGVCYKWPEIHAARCKRSHCKEAGRGHTALPPNFGHCGVSCTSSGGPPSPSAQLFVSPVCNTQYTHLFKAVEHDRFDYGNSLLVMRHITTPLASHHGPQCHTLCKADTTCPLSAYPLHPHECAQTQDHQNHDHPDIQVYRPCHAAPPGLGPCHSNWPSQAFPWRCQEGQKLIIKARWSWTARWMRCGFAEEVLLDW